MVKRSIASLIRRAQGPKALARYESFQLDDLRVLAESAQKMLSAVPPQAGHCVLISSGWAVALEEHYGVPAVVVAGDLKIRKTKVFKYKKALPVPGKGNRVHELSWDGHCWLEVGGYVGDLSIFRTVNALPDDSEAKLHMLERFGYGRGAFLMPRKDLSDYELDYIPQAVLSTRQVDAFHGALGHQLGLL